jgi:hypothetical protein
MMSLGCNKILATWFYYATHQTNNHDWKLFSRMIRDTTGSCISGAHFLVKFENTTSIKVGLKFIRKIATSWECFNQREKEVKSMRLKIYCAKNRIKWRP